jgi:peptidoglycan/xylan/chitin deacetylase (PgdA/CDA1 family)
MVARCLSVAGGAVAGRGRRLVKAIAEAALPPSVVVWRGSGLVRRVALTFDDGPSDLTRAYLDVLESAGARATFFVVGELCAKNPVMVGEISQRGHELAGHGYSHRRFPSLCKLGLLRDELYGTARLLPADPRARSMVRPPHGAVSPASLAACAGAGFTTVLWSRDSGDCRTTQASEVVARTLRAGIEPGMIVLFHDGQSWTLEALRTVVTRIAGAGHEMVTVSELLGRRGCPWFFAVRSAVGDPCHG